MAGESLVPRLLTIKEVADATGLAPWRVYELIQKGQAPPYLRVGKTYRFSAPRLVQWIEEQHNQHATDQKTATRGRR